MAKIRFKPRHAKRALAGAFAACVAATAMAYSSGGLQNHGDEAPDPSKLQQQQSGGASGGDQVADTQDNGGGQGSTQLADNGGAPGGGGPLTSPPSTPA